jgi:AraC family transcriptional regulator
MELKIKNMVCDRCIQRVKLLLDGSEIKYSEIDLGSVQLEQPLSREDEEILASQLKELGFELLSDRDSQFIEAVKNAIIKLIYHQPDYLKKFTISAYIEKEVGKDYKWLSALFSSKEGNTIEHYVITQKIERVKELLSYKELNIGEIADKLHYSSVAHLSNQFKKITGKTPSQFKTIGTRKALDKL